MDSEGNMGGQPTIDQGQPMKLRVKVKRRRRRRMKEKWGELTPRHPFMQWMSPKWTKVLLARAIPSHPSETLLWTRLSDEWNLVQVPRAMQLGTSFPLGPLRAEPYLQLQIGPNFPWYFCLRAWLTRSLMPLEENRVTIIHRPSVAWTRKGLRTLCMQSASTAGQRVGPKIPMPMSLFDPRILSWVCALSLASAPLWHGVQPHPYLTCGPKGYLASTGNRGGEWK